MTAICGGVLIDLRIKGDDDDPADHQVSRAIQQAANAPAGANVTFIVARGQYRPSFAVAYLLDHGRHLGSITIECSDPYTVARWVAELRSESEVA